MLSTGLAFLIAFATAAAVTPFIRDIAIKRALAPRPRGARDVHEAPIPRLGGIAIVLAFLVPLIGIFLVDSGIGRYLQRNTDWLNNMVAMLGGGVLIAGLGVYDDLRGANAYQKFAVQILVACMVWGLGVRIDVIGVFGSSIDLGYLSLPVTVIWIVGVINAMNLIDGLDGLASGVAFMAILPTLIISIYAKNVIMMVTMASLGGAILGFLLYNFRPASIFMGDTGSMFLGFVLATASLLGSVKSSAVVSMIAPVLALGVPIMDTLLAVFRRSVAGMPVFHADNDHVHHRLLAGGMSHRGAVLVLYGASAVFAAAALASSFANGRQMAVLLLVVAISAGVFLRKLGYLAELPSVDRRRRNKRIRAVVRDVCRRIRSASDRPQIWQALEPLRTELDCGEVSLQLGDETYSWRDRKINTRRSTAHLYLPLGEDEQIGALRVVWKSGEIVRREDEVVFGLVTEAIDDVLLRQSAAGTSDVLQLPNRHARS